MADIFDALDRLIISGTKEMQRNGSAQMYAAFDPNKAAAMERMAQGAQMRRMNRQVDRMRATKTESRAQMKTQSSDDGIGLGGAALAGGALLALGALAYNALSSDDSSKSGNSSADASTN